MTWLPTGVAAATVTEGSLREVVLQFRPVVLARVEGRIHALDGACPHIGGSLAEGALRGRRLTCPLHEATFDVTDGSVVTDPFGVTPPEGGVGAVAVFPTREHSGMIEVDLPDAAPS